MSTFGKSKRFEDNATPTPAPGSYNPKPLDKAPAASILGRRRESNKENGPPVGHYLKMEPKFDRPSVSDSKVLKPRHNRMSKSSSSLNSVPSTSSENPMSPLSDCVFQRREVLARDHEVMKQLTDEREERILQLESSLEVANMILKEKMLEIEELGQEINVKNKEATSSIDRLCQLETERTDMLRQTEADTKLRVEAEEDSKRLKVEMEQILERHRASLAELEKENDAALQSRDEALRQLQIKKEEALETLKVKEKRLADYEEKKIEMEKAVEEKIKELRRACASTESKLLSRISELQAENQSVQAQATDLREKLIKVERQKSLADETLVDVTRASREVLSKLQSEFEGATKRHEADLKEALDRNSLLREECLSERQQKSLLCDQMAKQQEEIEAQEVKYVLAEVAHEEILEAKQTQYNRVLEQVRSKLEESQKNAEIRVQSLTSDIESLKGEIIDKRQIHKENTNELLERITELNEEINGLRSEAQEKEETMKRVHKEDVLKLQDLSTILEIARKDHSINEKSLRAENQSLRDKINECEKKNRDIESSLERKRKQVAELWQAQETLKNLLPKVEDKQELLQQKAELEREVFQLRIDLTKKESDVLNAYQEVTENQDELEKKDRQLKLVKDELALAKKELKEDTSEKDQLRSETNKWKNQVDDLTQLIGPFKDQLEQYGLERIALEDRNKNTEKELGRLADDYARHMGHQNHKQKIHHLITIKEDKIRLMQKNQELELELKKVKAALAKLSKK